MRALLRFLYALARTINDINAVASGRVIKRLINKSIGRNVVRRFWLR